MNQPMKNRRHLARGAMIYAVASAAWAAIGYFVAKLNNLLGCGIALWNGRFAVANELEPTLGNASIVEEVYVGA